MQPSDRSQIKWGAALSALAILVILLFALVPDPFHRQHLMTVGLDQVDGIGTGAPIYFRGAQVGSVRRVSLVPATRAFDVDVGIRRDWQSSACTFLTVSAANPLTQPHLELVALETSAQSCPAMRAAAACDPVPAPNDGRSRLVGCKRAPDLIAIATSVVTSAASTAKTANGMVLKLQAMLGGAGGASGGPGLATDFKGSVRSLANVLGGVDRSLAPGRGDLALTLANVRRASDQAARFDMGSVNNTLSSVSAMVAENRRTVQQLLDNGQQISGQSRDLLESTSRSLAQTSANLARLSNSMDTFADRVSADPGFAVRGQHFADPPPVTHP